MRTTHSKKKPSRSTANWNLLLVLTMFFIAIAGCKNPNAIEQARQRGAAAGRADGLAAGQAEGYKSAYQPAKDAAYKATIGELYTANDYSRNRNYTVMVLAGAFLLGFSLQYLVLYLLRSGEWFLDVDWIVLPKQKTQIDLSRPLIPQPAADAGSMKQGEPTRG